MNSITRVVSKIALSVLFVSPLFAALPVPLAQAAPLNSLIKGSGEAVYWYASNGQRYVFPNVRVYSTWFPNFNGVITISDSELASIQLGGNVTYRPGAKLIKVESDPKTYAVSRNGILHWVTSEYLASQLYGPSWAFLAQDVPVVFFTNYTVGTPIYTVSDFNVSTEYNGVSTPSDSLPIASAGSNYSSNGTLTASQTSVSSGQSILLSASFPQYGTVGKIEIVQNWDGVVIYNCPISNTCNLTVYPYISGLTSVQYAARLRSASDNSVLATAWSPTITVGSGTNSASTLTVDKTNITSGATVYLTASFPGFSSNGTITIKEYRNYPANYNSLMGQVYVCSVNPCTFNLAVSQNSNEVGVYYVASYAQNGVTQAQATSPVIAFGGSGQSSQSGSVYINGLTLIADQTSITNGGSVRLTANAYSYGNWDYQGNRLEIWDSRNNVLAYTCYNQSWCVFNTTPRGTVANPTAQYQVRLYDRTGSLVMSQYGPVIAISGITSDASSVSGSDRFNGSTSLSAVLLSHVVSNGTQMDTISATMTNPNTDIRNVTINLYDAASMALLASCTNSATCNATLIGNAPLNRTVFARAVNQYGQTVESNRISTP